MLVGVQAALEVSSSVALEGEEPNLVLAIPQEALEEIHVHLAVEEASSRTEVVGVVTLQALGEDQGALVDTVLEAWAGVVEEFPFRADQEELEEVEAAYPGVVAQEEPTCQAVEAVTACRAYQACLALEWVARRQRAGEVDLPVRGGSVLRATFRQLTRVARPWSLS